MRSKPLTEDQKREICKLYRTNVYTQDNLAWLFQCHRRTIYRALEAEGLTTPTVPVGSKHEEAIAAINTWRKYTGNAPTLAGLSLINQLREIYGMPLPSDHPKLNAAVRERPEYVSQAAMA